jgi:hypothetical protein
MSERWITILALLVMVPPARADARTPVVQILDNIDDLKKRYGDGAFIPALKDGYDARADLSRFVWHRMKHTRNKYELRRWREVLRKQPAYVWHCHGVERESSRFVDCRIWKYDKSRKPLKGSILNEVLGGGTDYCHANFSLKFRRLVELQCNGDE